jgi:hypothetical protein
LIRTVERPIQHKVIWLSDHFAGSGFSGARRIGRLASAIIVRIHRAARLRDFASQRLDPPATVPVPAAIYFKNVLLLRFIVAHRGNQCALSQ